MMTQTQRKRPRLDSTGVIEATDAPEAAADSARKLPTEAAIARFAKDLTCADKSIDETSRSMAAVLTRAILFRSN